MSQLQNFLFENQEVRFVGTVDVPEWLAVDVCKILELGNPSQALSDFDEDEKGITTSDTPGGSRRLIFPLKQGWKGWRELGTQEQRCASRLFLTLLTYL